MKMAARDNEKAGVHKISSQAGQRLLQSEESRKPMVDSLKSDDMGSGHTNDFSKSLASISGGKQQMQIPPKSVQEGAQLTSLPPQIDKKCTSHIDASKGASFVRFPSSHGVSVCTEKIPMESIFNKFSSTIEKILTENHSSVSVTFERNDKNAICVLQGARGDVKKAESKLRDIVKTFHKREVSFPTSTNRALKDISIEDIVSDLLKDKYPRCVAQQLHNKIVLYGFDEEVLKKAVTYLSMTIVGTDMLLCGRLRELKELVVDHFKSEHKDLFVVHVDNTCRLYMVGLKQVVAKASSDFVELKEGRKSLSPQQTISYTYREQPKIFITKGYLDQATADVIVNTADRNLDLSYGKVSHALLKAAGQELQNECRKQFPNGIRCDEVAVTDGYKLNCKRVFHITLQTQDRSSAGLIQSIRNAMLLCLKTASDYGYKSIAFPAMGTGSLGYPSEEVASEMIMGVERFSKEHRRRISMQEVQFVIFPTDDSLLQIFQKMKTKLVDTRIPVKSESEPDVRFGITGVGKDVYAFKTWLDSRDKLAANAKATNVSGSTSGHNRSCSAARHSADDRTYLCGNISIKVYEANVLEVSVDCIVSPANKNLDTECTELIKEKGNLQNCKHILHAVGPDYTDYKPFTKSSLDKYEHELYQTILNSLYQASELKFQTVALPMMTSGVYRVPEEVRQICAIQFAKAIKDFSSACPSLQEIHVVDENRDMIDIIHKTFDAILNNGKPAPFDTAKFIVQIKNVHASYTCNSKTLACKLCSDVELEVQVYESDIVNLKGIDAVVCSENRVGGAKGIVARLLLQKGGEEYKKEKASMFQSQPRFGEIITTRGGGNTYSSIIHAILSRKDPNAIPLMYSKIFKEVEEKGFTSVSIPLLGTGVGDVDPGSSSEMLLAQLIQFCQTNSKPFTLHVVINDKPVAEVVKDVFKRRIYEMEREQRAETKGMDSKNVEEKTVPTDTGAATSKEKADADGDCVICMDKVTDAKTLKCGHMFCAECIEGYFRVKKVCPTCGEVCGTITGDQPDGRMDIVKQPANVAGFEKYKSIAITYTFSHGTQGPDHPRPGLPYKGIRRTAYLPDNREGRQICAMLKVAFARRLVFTIGTSRTTGKECVITWNDIHHKTDMRPNTQFGYPDETYLQRVREELEAKGVSLQDVEKNFIKELKADDFRETFATDTRL